MEDAVVHLQRLYQFLKIRRSVKARSSGERGRQLASSSGAGAHLYGLCRRFSLAEIEAATNNFHQNQMIGRGRIGPVYKGFIDNGTLAVAVKRLSYSSTHRLDQFKTEVRMLCQLRHPNLALLIGFCYEVNGSFLVYEYMDNLTLQHHLFEPLESGRDPLSWEQRLKICIAISRGLHYLHAGVKYAIIHRDVKSSNILLDENWNAKMSDFGLAKIGPLSLSKSIIRMHSRIEGAIRYVDPEYFSTGQVTEKSDIYLFGIVLLEVLCARKAIDMSRDEDRIELTRWARECIENGSIYSIIDPFLEGKVIPESFQKFVQMAYDCTHKDGRDRPSMGEVEVTLELALELQEKAQLHV